MSAEAVEPWNATWFVWSNGTEDGSWHKVNEGTAGECVAFAAARRNPLVFVQEPGVMYLVLQEGEIPATHVERHRFHSFAQYPDWCQFCQHDRDEARDIDAKQHVAEISHLVHLLCDNLGDADRTIGNAITMIGELCSDRVFDVELVEGDGNDLLAELQTAARAVRNAQRIAARRAELLREQAS